MLLYFVSAFVAQSQESAAKPGDRPLLTTAVTGSVNASGLDDPQFVLSFIPVQRLMLDAAQRPLSREEIDKGLAGTLIKLDDLLRLQLLRKQQDSFVLNYLLLTVQDQEEMYRASARYGLSLADAFRAHKPEFDAILARYPDASLRSQLMFGLIAGAALNWGGLDLTTELGYRVQPPRHGNAGTYLIHSAQVGAQLDFTGLYLDSQTAPGSKMSFSTFGDGRSLPRLQGMPDVFDGLENAMEDWRKLPEVYAALRTEYITLLLLAMDDAGQLMSAVAGGADTDESLVRSLPLPESRRKAILRLLLSIGYLREADRRYLVGVPVLSERDKPLVEAALKLSREIMTEWLQKNYPSMKNDFAELSAMRNGLPFSLAFSEVWHYQFGFATRSLAESGFYANPRAEGNRYRGYVPLVWANSLLKMPGIRRSEVHSGAGGPGLNPASWPSPPQSRQSFRAASAMRRQAHSKWASVASLSVISRTTIGKTPITSPAPVPQPPRQLYRRSRSNPRVARSPLRFPWFHFRST
jgi:hypothetical protein